MTNKKLACGQCGTVKIPDTFTCGRCGSRAFGELTSSQRSAIAKRYPGMLPRETRMTEAEMEDLKNDLFGPQRELRGHYAAIDLLQSKEDIPPESSEVGLQGPQSNARSESNG